MFLGIEIGGTKLQLGVGDGSGRELAAVQRCDVDPQRKAGGILEQIERAAASLMRQFPVERIGVGFGGPVVSTTGQVIESHQVEGWDGFELGTWCQRQLGVPATVGNDCDVAALAEARCGAGCGCKRVFFVTAGTGVGGGFVVDGRLYGTDRPAAAEIGQMRPGVHAEHSDATVESLASGTGIADAARARISGEWMLPIESFRRRQQAANSPRSGGSMDAFPDLDDEYKQDLLARADGDAERLTARMVAQAAEQGNAFALEILHDACESLGWAIAQVITLLAPEVVVVGGGVSLMGEALFFDPLRHAVRHYVFPPLTGSYKVLPAALGELVVVHGAIALAQQG